MAKSTVSVRFISCCVAQCESAKNWNNLIFEPFAVSICATPSSNQKENEMKWILIFGTKIKSVTKCVSQILNKISLKWTRNAKRKHSQQNWWATRKILIKDYNAVWQFRTLAVLNFSFNTQSSMHHHTHSVPIRFVLFWTKGKKEFRNTDLLCSLTNPHLLEAKLFIWI